MGVLVNIPLYIAPSTQAVPGLQSREWICLQTHYLPVEFQKSMSTEEVIKSFIDTKHDYIYILKLNHSTYPSM